MLKFSLSVSVVALVALVAGLLAVPVQAATIYDVEFQLNVTSGFQAGHTYQGSLSYSDEFRSGIGHEVLVPGPNPSGFLKAEFLSLSFDYVGQTFTMADDDGSDHVDHPWIYFENGDIAGLDYYGDDQFGQFVVGIGMTDLFTGSLSYTQTFGNVTFFAPVARIAAVAEPSSWGLLCLGASLVLIAVCMRSSRKWSGGR